MQQYTQIPTLWGHGRKIYQKQRQPWTADMIMEEGLRPAVVLILGHSFVHRLQSFMEREFSVDHNLGCDAIYADVHFHGIGGRTAPRTAEHDLGQVDRIRPDLVHVELGTNDLAWSHVTPEMVRGALMELVSKLQQKESVKFVTIGQTIWREGVGIPGEVPEFNHKVIALNQLSKEVFDGFYVQNSKYWKHTGLWHSSYPILLQDGVHLTDYSQMKLMRSIRGAVFHGYHKIRHLL
jgi:lysophospholipase L1-like esterase